MPAAPSRNDDLGNILLQILKLLLVLIGYYVAILSYQLGITLPSEFGVIDATPKLQQSFDGYVIAGAYAIEVIGEHEKVRLTMSLPVEVTRTQGEQLGVRVLASARP